MDPRISERKKTAVMCVRFVQALERRYQELYLSDQSIRSRRALRRNLLLCGVRKDKVTDALIDRVSKTQKEIFQMRFGPLGKGETESSRSLAILSSIVPMVFHRNESLQRAGRKLTRPLGGAKYDPASELGDIRRVMSLTSFHKYTKQLRGVGEGPGRVPTPVSDARRRKNQSY
jgi:hypothetical protein